MMIRLPPAVQIEIGALIEDDGETLKPGPAVNAMIVPLEDLKGSRFYDALILQVAEWKKSSKSNITDQDAK